MRIYPFFILVCLSVKLYAQDSVAYGLILPTIEQLKRIPFTPSFSLPPDFVFPPNVDLSSDMPPVGMQGYQGSCAAFAVVYAAKSYQEKKQYDWKFVEDGVVRYNRICSPSFLFNSLKKSYGENNCLSGISFKSALEFLIEYGTPFMDKAKYDESNCTYVDNNLLKDARANSISSYESPRTNLTKIKYNLSIGNPVIIGVLLDDFFQNDGFDAYKNGEHYVFRQKGILKEENYHAMVCVGYDESKKIFKVMNSYGKNWGNSGYLDIPYQTFSEIIIESYILIDARRFNLFIGVDKLETDTSKTIITPTKLSSWLKKGYHRMYKGLKISLADLNYKDSTIAVSFSKAQENNQTTIYKLNVPKIFYLDDQRITFELNKIEVAKGNKEYVAFFTVQIDYVVDVETLQRGLILKLLKTQSDIIKGIMGNQDSIKSLQGEIQRLEMH